MADGNYRSDGQRFAADITNNVITPKVLTQTASDDALLTRVGEVQESPTPNTVLARLKDLLTGIILAAGSKVRLVDSFGQEFDYTQPTNVTSVLKYPTDTSQAVFAQSTVADHTVVAGVANQAVRVHRLIISTGGAVNVTVKRGSTTLGVLRFAAATNVPFIIPFSDRPYYITDPGEALVFALSAAVAVDATVGYVQGA